MPIITIFGATGSQGAPPVLHYNNWILTEKAGSSVLGAVLADGKYTPRAVSRRLDSDASKALSARGVEVVKANLFDKESVKAAIRGSDAVFGVSAPLGSRHLQTSYLGFSGHQLLGSRSLQRHRPERHCRTHSGKESRRRSEGSRREVLHLEVCSLAGLSSIFKLFNPYIQAPCPTRQKKRVDCISTSSTLIVRPRCSFLLFPDILRQTKQRSKSISKHLGFLTLSCSLPGSPKISGSKSQPILKYARRLLLLDRSFGSLQKTDTGFTIPIPHFGAAAVALLSNYADPSKGVIGGSFPVVSMKFTYPQLAAAIAKGAHLVSRTD
jgi:hypothetical protein